MAALSISTEIRMVEAMLLIEGSLLHVRPCSYVVLDLGTYIPSRQQNTNLLLSLL